MASKALIAPKALMTPKGTKWHSWYLKH